MAAVSGRHSVVGQLAYEMCGGGDVRGGAGSDPPVTENFRLRSSWGSRWSPGWERRLPRPSSMWLALAPPQSEQGRYAGRGRRAAMETGRRFMEAVVKGRPFLSQVRWQGKS
jgi:hypothetical protein